MMVLHIHACYRDICLARYPNRTHRIPIEGVLVRYIRQSEGGTDYHSPWVRDGKGAPPDRRVVVVVVVAPGSHHHLFIIF